jgi:RNA recognition motif-containing protein
VTDVKHHRSYRANGVVKQVNVINGKGFGFVEMSSQSEAEAAKDALNDTDFRGRTLRIDEAHPPRPYRNRERTDFRRFNNNR